MSDAVCHLDGDLAVPTELARGPWSPDAQHGGAPAALLARALERADPGPARFVSRLTVELLRPVPLTPIEVRTRTLRPGKKVQWLQGSPPPRRPGGPPGPPPPPPGAQRPARPRPPPPPPPPPPPRR